MKRQLRTYLSLALLFCLAMQFVPVGMLHSHDNHAEGDKHESVHFDHAKQSSSSDFHFKVADDCDLCDLLLSLHDQSLSFGSVQEYRFDGNQALQAVDLPETAIDGAHLSVRGRAPPKA